MRPLNPLERLELAADMIGRHPAYPGKEVVEQECLDEIDQSVRLGLISAEDRAKLLALLSPLLS